MAAEPQKRYYETLLRWKITSSSGIWPQKLVTATCSPFFSIVIISYFSSFPNFGVLSQSCIGDPGQFQTLVAWILAQAAKWSEYKLVYFLWMRQSSAKKGGKKKERVIKGEQSTLYYKIIKLTVDQWEIKKAYDPKTVMTLGSSIDVHFQRNTL